MDYRNKNLNQHCWGFPQDWETEDFDCYNNYNQGYNSKNDHGCHNCYYEEDCDYNAYYYSKNSNCECEKNREERHVDSNRKQCNSKNNRNRCCFCHFFKCFRGW